MSNTLVYLDFLKSVDGMTSTGIGTYGSTPMPICGHITASHYV